MKAKDCFKAGDLVILWRTPREGPPSFLVWWPNVSTIFLDRQTLLNGIPSKPKGLTEWLDSLGVP